MSRSDKWFFSWLMINIVVGGANVFWLHFIDVDLLQFLSFGILALPLFIPPLGNRLGINTVWNIFNFSGSKK